MWGKARKKPIVIAFREVEPKEILPSHMGNTLGEIVKTREGALYAYVGVDYIIQGVEQELYPIGKGIFEKTYDIIEPIQSSQ